MKPRQYRELEEWAFNSAIRGNVELLEFLLSGASEDDAIRILIVALGKSASWLVRVHATETLVAIASGTQLHESDGRRVTARLAELGREAEGVVLDDRQRHRLHRVDPQRLGELSAVPRYLEPWFATALEEVTKAQARWSMSSRFCGFPRTTRGRARARQGG